MTSVLVTPPNSTALTTLARVKEEINPGNDHDVMLTRLIDEASETITQWARPFYRAEWRETREGSARELLPLSRYPIVSLGAVLLEDSAITDCEIGNAEAGLLFRPGGFGWSGDPSEWSVTYTAGWFLTGDDVSTAISVAAADKSYNSATSLFPALLRAGDVLFASQFTDPANNGFKNVVTATAARITVSQALVNEPAATRTLALRNLPGEIERVAIELVKGIFQASDRDRTIESVRIGDAALTYLTGDSHRAYTRSLQARISRYASPL